MQTIILPKPRPGSAGKESAVLDDELHVLIRKAYNRTNRAMVRFTAGLGLKPGQPKVLEYLSEHDGCTARDICQGCIIDKSTMAILLPRLEEQGLVRRETSRQDARMAHVYLRDGSWRAPFGKGRDSSTRARSRACPKATGRRPYARCTISSASTTRRST